MTPTEAAERFQRVLRVALQKVDTLRLPELDETYYDAFRDAMLGAGAVDGDIDVLAAFHVTVIVECTKPGSEDRTEQFELIVDHLARTHMVIGTSRDDCTLSVEFPDRPRAH